MKNAQDRLAAVRAYAERKNISLATISGRVLKNARWHDRTQSKLDKINADLDAIEQFMHDNP